MRHTILFAAVFLCMFSCSKEDTTTPPPPPIDDNNKLPDDFKALFNIFDGEGIGAATNLNDDIMLFISTNGDKYAWFENNQIQRTGRIGEDDGLFDGAAFSTISAINDYREERLVIFNEAGNTYQWIDVDPDNIAGNSNLNNHFIFLESIQLNFWGEDNTCPFDEITSVFGFSKEPEGCATSEDDDLYLWMANDDGDEVVRYVKENSTFDEEVEVDQWRSNSICGGAPAIFPLSGIGAACVYDPDAGIYQELFFDPSGTKMTILTPSQGSFSQVYDLK